jgi:DNA-binding MarR family transcriptional regulator
MNLVADPASGLIRPQRSELAAITGPPDRPPPYPAAVRPRGEAQAESPGTAGAAVRLRRVERDGVDEILAQWRRERPDLDPAPIGVVGRVSRLARELERRLEPVYRAHGLEPGWHDLLATLRRAGPPFRMRPTDLTDALMLTSSGTTKRLDRLERAGLVAREPDPADRRGTLIALTDDGRALIDRLTPDHLANEDRLLAGLSAGEREQLAALLRKLLLGLPGV